MKGVCAIHNGKALALVTRSGSHALMNLMLPEVYKQKVPIGLKEDLASYHESTRVGY